MGTLKKVMVINIWHYFLLVFLYIIQVKEKFTFFKCSPFLFWKLVLPIAGKITSSGNADFLQVIHLNYS